MDISKIKLIAYYLPQYYEIDFNNKYWGKGYTEWTVTAKAKPLYKGHYQPHVPADLGFYNLLMPEARKAQADMAKEYGIDGFCYWHYWFGGGKTIMEKPFNAVLESGEPNFPFCLCWANHSWHNPGTKQIIYEQKYGDLKDHTEHFYSLLNAFKDKRYITIDDRPVFAIFAPHEFPDITGFMNLWNGLAQNNGLKGIYFIGLSQDNSIFDKIKDYNFDAINTIRLKDFLSYQNKYIDFLRYRINFFHRFTRYKYSTASKHFIEASDADEKIIPTIIPGWDHTPRTNSKGLFLTDYTPDEFECHVRKALDVVSRKQNKLCFIKAWNEWGEGNHLEPDLKWGTQFLERLKKVKYEYE